MSSAVRFTVLCDELVRIEYAPQGVFSDWPSLVAIHAPNGLGPPHPARTVRTLPTAPRSRPIVLETARFRLEYRPDGHPPSPSNLRVLIRHAAPPPGVPRADGRVLWTPGATNRFNLGGTLETLDGVRGKVPTDDGLLARDGWFLLDDSRKHLLVDGWVRSPESLGLAFNTDWYFFAFGEDYRAALAALARIAGPVPIPRRCALGSWYSRYWPYTSAEYRGIVQEYHQHGFPLDVMVLDMDWHRDGWTGWSWNRDLLPDAEDLLSWIHAQQLAVTLNLHPADGVSPHEDRYPDFMRALGRDPASRQTLPFDAADRAQMSALFDHVLAPLERGSGHRRDGVDFWWLDWQQDRFTRSIPSLTNLRWLNHLFFQHSGSNHDNAHTRLRGLSFSRWAGWGDHRHPVHFSGDAHTGWGMLAFQVPFTAQSGHAGCFYWTHDIGGHFGPRFEETATRWVQFGALSAALRLHSARSATLDRRPWTYEPRFRDAMRSAFALRAELMPYIYTAARDAFDHHVPFIRAMPIDHPTDDRAYENPQQYLFGDDLLVAPIVRPGRGESCVAVQRLWFPPAHQSHPADSPISWFDWHTGEPFAAGTEAVVAAAIDEIPLFVRAGAPIPCRPFSLRPTSQPIDHLVIRLYPAPPGVTIGRDLYEDDGVSDAYQLGAYMRTPILARWTDETDCRDGHACGRLRIDVGPSTGAFDGAVTCRAITIELASVSACRVVESQDASSLAISHDADRAGGLTRIQLPPADVRSPRAIILAFERSDPKSISHTVRRERLTSAFASKSVVGPLPRAALAVIAELPGTDDAAQRDALAIGAGIAITPADGHWRLVDTHALIDPDPDNPAHTRVPIEIVERDLVGFEHDQITLNERLLESTLLTLSSAERSRAEQIPVPLDAPQPPRCGLVRQRSIRARFSLQRQPVTVLAPIARAVAPFQHALIAAPFPWDWRWSIDQARFAPELEPLDARTAHDPARPSAPRIAWVPACPSDHWSIDLTRSHPGPTGIAYVWIRLHADRSAVARLHIQTAGDKVEAWVAAESVPGVATAVGPRSRVFWQNGSDSHAAAKSYADVSLAPGVNHLLIKTIEGWRQWGLTAWLELANPCTLRELAPDEP